jgi:8-oxo-dGTP diphosphatase
MASMTRSIITDAHGRVLMLRRAAHDRFAGCWELPGGKLDAGETVLAGMTREVAEETGLQVLSAREHATSQVVTPSGQPMNVIICTARAQNDPVRLDPDEHQDFAWLSVAEAGLLTLTELAEHSLTLI